MVGIKLFFGSNQHVTQRTEDTVEILNSGQIYNLYTFFDQLLILPILVLVVVQLLGFLQYFGVLCSLKERGL